MNKKILVIAVALMFAAMFTAPVLAAPAEHVSFTATQIPNAQQPPQDPEVYRVWTTEGDVVHVRNMAGAGTIILRILGQTPISGTTSSSIDVNRNMKTGSAIAKFLMTWTFADSNVSRNDSFENEIFQMGSDLIFHLG